MDKALSIIQKSCAWIGIVAFGLLAIYALGMATPAACLLQYQEAIDFYNGVQPYNDMILYFAIFGLLLNALYFILRCQVRKIYYVSNFVWCGAATVYSLISGIMTIIGVSAYQAQWAALPFSDIQAYFASIGTGVSINPGTPVFALGYTVAILLILCSLLPTFLGVMKFLGKRKHNLAKIQEKEAQ